MRWPILVRVASVLAVATTLAYFALRTWRRGKNPETNIAGVDFRANIGFTRMDGWASLALLLINKSDSSVWTEEIEIAITGIIAHDQTAEASGREIQKIRQTVRPKDMLPISLVETIYLAAGKPQRRYSCLMSAVVRYRVGEDWFEKPTRPYRLKMAGLTVVSNHREGWEKSEFKSEDNLRIPQPAETKSK